ncbi:MAG: hypothetical protein NT029_02140 [Armatimonadetes bacterium]|nr:hypothetical protein [Armatimonadota bacterium]
MIVCPKCGSTVPDGRTTCQICSGPIDPVKDQGGPIGLKVPEARTAPPAGAGTIAPVSGVPGLAQPAATPGVERRVSLSGEVIEVPIVQTRPTAGPPTAGGPRPPSGGPAGPAPRAAGGIGMTRDERLAAARAPEQKSYAGLISAVVTLLVLAVAAMGGLMWYSNTALPANTATAFLEGIKAQKWAEVYDMVEFSAADRANTPKDKFVAQMEKMGKLATVTGFTVGEATVEGDTAKVKADVSVSIPMLGVSNTNAQSIPLKKAGFLAWKIDAEGAKALTSAAKMIPGK